MFKTLASDKNVYYKYQGRHSYKRTTYLKYKGLLGYYDIIEVLLDDRGELKRGRRIWTTLTNRDGKRRVLKIETSEWKEVYQSQILENI